ncbi:MAG: AAA family ATPase [Solirubrobacteraceae bacterium]
MTGNPFHYGTPAEGEHFAGRESELAALLSRLRSGINVVVIAPRRYGKTSLLLYAERRLQEDDPAIIHANVLRSRDLAAFVSRIATQAFRIPDGRWHRARQAVPAFLRRLRARPAVTFDGDHPKFGFDASLSVRDGEDILADVYGLLDEVAIHRPAVLVLDEFQAIVELGAHLPSLLKALADQHPNVSLVFAGSRRHLMEHLVSAPSATLYNMAEPIALGPLPEDVMAEHLRSRAASGRKPMSEDVARLIVELAGPAANDIQRLAYEAYDTAGTAIDEDVVYAGLAAAVAHNAPACTERYETLSPGQRRVLAALAEEPTEQPAGAIFLRRTAMANPSSVRKALDALRAAELIASRGKTLVVADPFLAAWLRG